MTISEKIKQAYPAAPNMAAGIATAATLVFDDSVDKESRLSLGQALSFKAVSLREDFSTWLNIGIKKDGAAFQMFRICGAQNDVWQPLADFFGEDAIEGISVIIYDMACRNTDVRDRILGHKLFVRRLSRQQQFVAARLLKTIDRQFDNDFPPECIDEAANKLLPYIKHFAEDAPCLSMMPIRESAFESFMQHRGSVIEKRQLAAGLYGANWQTIMEQSISDYCAYITSGKAYAKSLTSARSDLRNHIHSLSLNSAQSFLSQLERKLRELLSPSQSLRGDWLTENSGKLSVSTKFIRQQFKSADIACEQLARSMLGNKFIPGIFKDKDSYIDNNAILNAMQKLVDLRFDLDSFCLLNRNDYEPINIGWWQLVRLEQEDIWRQTLQCIGEPGANWSLDELHNAQMIVGGRALIWLCSETLGNELRANAAKYQYSNITYPLPTQDTSVVWVFEDMENR